MVRISLWSKNPANKPSYSSETPEIKGIILGLGVADEVHSAPVCNYDLPRDEA